VQRPPISSPKARATALLLLALTGCAVPVAAGLEETDANRIALALDRAHIDATKEPDPAGDGRYRVTVPKDEAPRALAVMREEELPRRRPAGVLDALGKGSLVPSRAAEHAQFVAGLAGDLERTLEGVDGVTSARVHLNVAAQDPLAMAPAGKTTASVLLEHRAGAPPVSEDAVRKIVAGGVAGLAAADVAVVLVARPRAAPRDEGAMAHVGPIVVAQGSARALEALLAGALLLVAALAASTLALYARLARAKQAR